jgi:SAM-dependent methyltransferase
MNDAEYAAMFAVEETHWWYTGMRRIGEAMLGERLEAATAILDAGCGTGGNLKWLARYGRAWGVDFSPVAVQFCRRRALGTVAQASVLTLPFPDRAFGLVTSFDVIYHASVVDDVAALREMRRVLRPGGALLVRVPAIEQLRSEHDAAVHTRQRYTLAELVGKVRAAGLTVERASYANALLFPLAVVARLAARHRGMAGRAAAAKQAPRSDVRPAGALPNAAFGAALGLEAALLRRWRLPIGLSAVVVARRAGEG